MRRRSSLLRCLQAATAASLALALPAVARAEQLSGTLRIVHADDPARGVSHDSYLLQTSSGSVPLKVGGAGLEQLAGQRVQVTGQPSGSDLVVRAGASGLQSLAAAPPALGLGSQTVAVILLTGTWGGSVPTAAQADSVVFSGPSSVDAFYREESWGKLSLRGAVFGPYVIPDSDAGCDFTRFGDDALAQARAHGQQVDGYQHYLFVFPYTAQCQWAGVAELPGARTWVNGELDLRVVGHELGHNFGLHHAASLSCDDASGRPAALTDSCSQDEYGDPYDNMGLGADGSRQLNAWHKEQAGWLGASAMQTVTASGTYTVAPLEQSANGPIGLRVPRPGRSDSLWIDFRQPSGTFDTYAPLDPAVNGVLIHVDPDATQIEQSRLLDATPGTTTFVDAALVAGHSFTDSGTGIRITTLSVSPLGAVVHVALDGSGVGVSPPTTPTGLRATRDGASVALSWLPASDDMAVSGYQVFRDGASAPIGSSSLPSFSDDLVAAGAHSYVVRAFDTDGNLSAPSVALSVADTVRASAPGSPSALRAVVKLQHGRLVAALSWSPSGGATSYEVLRGRTSLGTVARASFTDGSFLGSGLAAARYSVRATDADGRRSAPSAAFVLRRPAPPKLRLTHHALRHAGASRQLRATVRLVDVLRPARCRYRVNGSAWRPCPGSQGTDVTIAGPVAGRHGSVLLALRVSGADGRSLTRTFRVR